ncbi:kinase-like domain-containing protein [Tanacetum coccineum]
MLPISIGNLCDQLSSPRLGDNQLFGSVPSSIGSLVGLTYLDLRANRYKGKIPTTIVKLEKLLGLSLLSNQFSGPIPDAIGNLSMLTKLSLQSNNLESHIPSSLGNCTKLIGIILSYNRLSGKIPTHILQLPSLTYFLDLSYNSLSGLVPSEIKDLRMLNLRGSTKNLIGEGGFSSVYKGILDSEDNRFVAVKIDTDLSEDNLYCHQSSTSSKSRSAQKFSSRIFGLRVYAQWKCTRLASLSANTLKLNLLQRISILRDVATALDYLHNRCQTTIIHGDLMPSNILLDADIVAHVGDFGLARLLGAASNQTSQLGLMEQLVMHLWNDRIGAEIEKEAWKLHCESIVDYCVTPVGTLAVANPVDRLSLNYDQVFIRNFALKSSIAGNARESSGCGCRRDGVHISVASY